jgi:hypothetical protein
MIRHILAIRDGRMSVNDEELASAAVYRAVNDEDVDANEVRKARLAAACVSEHSSAETVYRTVVWLCDQLPPDAQTQLAVCFEWAREGIVRQAPGEISQELKALHAAYTYARDVMLHGAQRKNGG